MNRLIRASACTIILLGLTATRARGDLTIGASPVGILPGGTVTMDLTITSNSADTLSQFDLELAINQVAGPTSQLIFTTAQPNPYGNPKYVFDNDSWGTQSDSPFWSLPLTPTSILGGDTAGAFPTISYVTIPATAGDPQSYLASVQFQVPPTAAIGDQFQISLVTTGPQAANTYFDDQYGNPLTITSSYVGTVSVVPEPSTFLLMAISNLGILLYLRLSKQAKLPE